MHLLLKEHARRTLVVLLLTFVFVAGPVLGARPANAATTFTVNLLGDAADLDSNDNVCDASVGAGSQCSLRAAIQQANATPGADTIHFNIPGRGVKTIRPNAELPFIEEAVTIDGYSQPGASPNTLAAGTNATILIELDGNNQPLVDGLEIAAPNVVLKGLAINRYVVAVDVFAANARIEGCFLGTDPTGAVARPNTVSGVEISDGGTVVGGPTPAARNLISGNAGPGVIVILGELGNRVEGNLIGTTKDGAGNLGNGGPGVTIGVSSGTTIGGNSAETANTIAYNGADGVTVAGDGTGNRVLRNSIFANGEIGIDLKTTFATDGPTPNDPGDADTGANNLQNKPVLTSAANVGRQTIVRGNLNSTPNASFVLRFFANPPGSDEGKEFRRQLSVVTNASGDATFTFVPTAPIPAGQTVTATATSAGGNTSEFSVPRTVTQRAGRPRG